MDLDKEQIDAVATFFDKNKEEYKINDHMYKPFETIIDDIIKKQ
jgi:hypothetical protein